MRGSAAQDVINFQGKQTAGLLLIDHLNLLVGVPVHQQMSGVDAYWPFSVKLPDAASVIFDLEQFNLSGVPR